MLNVDLKTFGFYWQVMIQFIVLQTIKCKTIDCSLCRFFFPEPFFFCSQIYFFFVWTHYGLCKCLSSEWRCCRHCVKSKTSKYLRYCNHQLTNEPVWARELYISRRPQTLNYIQQQNDPLKHERQVLLLITFFREENSVFGRIFFGPNILHLNRGKENNILKKIAHGRGKH